MAVDRVLIIDDSEIILQAASTVLEEDGFKVYSALDGATGLEMYKQLSPDVVLLDIQMPGMNGEEVLREIVDFDPVAAVIMVTSVDELETVRSTLRRGAYDYLLKPVHMRDLAESARRAAAHRRLRVENQRYHARLEQLVEERTAALQRALKQVQDTYDQTILALGSALETRDVETQSHSLRVAAYTRLFCRALGMANESNLAEIERGAILHDIGKIGVPDRILNKPGSLDDEEWEVMRRHPIIGQKLLEPISFLQEGLPIVRNHHERWDGNGYPDRLAGEQIPLAARVFSIADTIDAITSVRPYRAAQPFSVAREAVENGSGTQFDPRVVETLRTVVNSDLERIRTRYRANQS